jgi:hypothetical protein
LIPDWQPDCREDRLPPNTGRLILQHLQRRGGQSVHSIKGDM